MYSQVNTAMIRGLEASLILVEADVSDGMPLLEMVGFLSSEVKEARERVRTALRQMGIRLPIKRITINLSPASIRKSGTGFDLPMAVAILSAMGLIDRSKLKDLIALGELGLDGKLQGIRGVLPMLLEAKEEGMHRALIPLENAQEASYVPGLQIIAVEHMQEVLDYFQSGRMPKRTVVEEMRSQEQERGKDDFAYIRGQKILRRACEIAVSGRHNLLMIGPPGAGKSMVAKAIPSILPPMSEEERFDLSKIYSICGLLGSGEGLLQKRPFRAPHHTISPAGLAGGGAIPKPGEITLAHGGVLFLDELPEFSRASIEILRQPLEEKCIRIVRQQADYTFPADFMLLAAMNPCPCGYYPDQSRCRCSPMQVKDYLSRISQALMDRIDLCAAVLPLRFSELVSKEKVESSKEIGERVLACRRRQEERYAKEHFSYNGEIPIDQIERFCPMGEEERNYLQVCFEQMHLSARGYSKFMRVARTIADLDESERILRIHLQETRLLHGFSLEDYGMIEGRGL